MVKHHKWLIVGVIVGIAASAMAIGSSALINRGSNAAFQATDSVRVVDDRKLPGQWAINAAYGRGALSNLRAALIEVTNDNAQEARKGVAVARSLLSKIKIESSLNAEISAGEMQTEPDFVLVHSEVRVLGEANPLNSVQATLDSIRDEFDMTDHDAIVAALNSLNVPLAYTRIDLPVTETIALVDDILRALDAQDSDQVRSKLMKIGSGLRIETMKIGLGDSSINPADNNDAG
jgi:hypothetical protein